MWKSHPSWSAAETAWDRQAEHARITHPIKELRVIPQMVGVTPETAKGLRWKSFKWMVQKDVDRKILRYYLKHPFRYGWNYVKSLIAGPSYQRDRDFFFYGISNQDAFEKLLADSENLFVLGFSYCHKPFECPSGRFTPTCAADSQNPVCQQCFIGKCVHAAPSDTKTLFIPTVHYIGEKIFEILHANPKKKLIFLITACEMTLKMFADWGNMTGIKGIGVRLDGRICNTMKAFALSEEGIKPGLTVVAGDTQKRMLDLLRKRYEHGSAMN